MSMGLENVVAAETRLSCVDGLRGQLIIAGYTLDELAGRIAFEDVARLLLDDQFETAPDAAEFGQRLGAARAKAGALIAHIDEQLLALPPMDGVRAIVARLPDGEDLETAFALLATPAVILPAILRKRRGLEPIYPDASLTHAHDMVRMLGVPSSADLAGALDTYLVTVSDHGLNASTFVARVVASTWSGLTSSVVAELGALKGPLHGGAPGPVLEMLDEIGEPECAVGWIERALDRGDRLMGFGHRVYKVRDPRADALKQAVKRLTGTSREALKRLALA